MKGLFSRRVRLALRYGLLFALVQMVLVVAITLARGSQASAGFDADLLRQTVETAAELGSRPESWDEDHLAGVVASSKHLLHLEVWDENGKRVKASSEGIAALLPPLVSTTDDVDVRTEDLRLGESAHTGDVADVVREATVAFRAPSGRMHNLRAITRSNPGTVRRRLVWDRILTFAPIAFIVSALVAVLLVRSALEPISRVSQAVSEIGPETLGSAVAVDDVDGDDTIAGLQSALNDALARLEHGYEAQARFVADVSHELKTPIAVLMAEAQSLPDAKASREDLIGFRDSTVEEMQRLAKLVESFLVVARSRKRGVLTRDEPVELIDVVVGAVGACARLADSRDVRVVPHVDAEQDAPIVRGDPDLLRSMLENLIRNACRFAPGESTVDVRLARDAGDAVLTVQDRGPGVPDDFVERLFDRFQQAGGEDDRRGGFGLGLSIAANVARLHDGSIAARNADEGGAVFTVRLPLPLPPGARADAVAG